VELDPDDLKYFVAYVLLDEAHRTPSGKRQVEPMNGFWMSRQGKLRAMRKSDRRIRWCVCIEAFRSVEQMSVEKAAVEVAGVLGRSTASEVAVIRVAYYECQLGRYQLNSFFQNFLHWRKWLLASDEETLRIILEHYGRAFGQGRRARLGSLLDDVRSDPRQIGRNRDWHLEAGQEQMTRIDSNHWDQQTEWQQLARDLWILGRIHAGLNDVYEARDLMERALGLWSTYGAVLPHVQLQAIADLKDEIGRLPASADEANTGLGTQT
jgi:hypothetical protein